MGTFFGRPVRERVGVVILAAEGAGTMAHRIEAARRARTAPEALPIAWTGDVPNLADPKNVADMIGRLQAVGARFRDEYDVRLGVVIVDTVAAAFHLKDENDNAEGARVVNHLRQMGDALGCLVMPVHHYGKSADTGLRGASAFRAGADAVISVLADRNEATGEVTRRRLALAKSRTRDEGAIGDFELSFEALGTDQFGDDFGACFVVPTDATKATAKRRPKLKPSARTALRALREAIEDYGETAPASNYIPAGRKVVTLERWRDQARRIGISTSEDPRAQRLAMQRASTSLVDDEVVGIFENYVWIADDGAA